MTSIQVSACLAAALELHCAHAPIASIHKAHRPIVLDDLDAVLFPHGVQIFIGTKLLSAHVIPVSICMCTVCLDLPAAPG